MEWTRGGLRPGLYAVIGHEGTGKTALMLQMASGTARAGRKTSYCAMYTDHKDMIIRKTAADFKLPMAELVKSLRENIGKSLVFGRYTGKVIKAMDIYTADVRNQPSCISFNSLEEMLKELEKRMRSGFKTAFIDSVNPDIEGHERMAEFIAELNRLVFKHKTAIVMAYDEEYKNYEDYRMSLETYPHFEDIEHYIHEIIAVQPADMDDDAVENEARL